MAAHDAAPVARAGDGVSGAEAVEVEIEVAGFGLGLVGLD